MITQNTVDEFINKMKEEGYVVRENVALKDYTSLEIGGPARLLAEPYCSDEIKCLVTEAKRLNIPFYVLGNGSNVLASDFGFQGLIIVTKTNFNQIMIDDDTNIIAQSGATLKDVCSYAYEHSLSGLEFAWGIPATVGGAAYMNAGAYGGEMKDVMIHCSYMDGDGNFHMLNSDELFFSYRHSFFSDKNVVILEAKFGLWNGNQTKIKELMDDLLERRKAKQPLEYPSAGSTFKRPEGNYASALIEQSGMKGYKHKNAMVSDKHAGFVINHNHATSKEFLELIDIVKKEVKAKTGYELECEVRIIGEEAD
ncbi:UDP-N-acetylmuramate dehydrogenase [Breznakia sp. PF5-3]|uniref:UDP-N-acetylmuramate dehydrogenase n=1 Tax=unclassified Breznakia TaxID=2623764 RepID=UPI002405A7BA|nr:MULTISPECIES: UDP-N-acetylmuramate dehydrogenase [unclassified Breznakia]MDF9824018.1 UDP-N-acetylmuramate dehydrogenase [Breznakia sp. PM6-1]MDF9834817.1 UDP-N-acetylmuramate dehydrogenase [Breznakia sp. PF5-3]MDF9838136.1 UDP-N-acetylmuramate dehydrogenase [Breznakia sp. PFB2-8]MDF9860122.1 UDP-N-acetylmuramate dehydrogenase [Breznakia sp. PH5-24]